MRLAGFRLDTLRARWAITGALFVGTLVLYSQVAGHQFLHFDDDQYVTDNPVVRGGLSWRGIAWAFTTLQVSNWHPLTWLSHMLDVQLFGLDAGAHHLVNAGLHALNAALLFVTLRAMTGSVGRSALVAALFAVHPLHVESVAWVSERKDVLSTLFGLLMLLAYVRHARRPGLARHALIVLLMAASLLAKPMWVTAPFLLLLLDVWPLQRIAGLRLDPAAPSFPTLRLRSILIEKLPLLALSIASSMMTVNAQHRGGSIQTLENLDVVDRAGNAVVSYARYVEKTLWPTGLSAFYPLPEDAGVWPVAAASVLLLALTALVAARARRAPWLAVGWCWFLGTLVPVIGIVQVGDQAMADRYTYLPLIGLFIAVVWEAARAADRWRPRGPALLPAAALLLVGILAAAVTWRQIGFWSDQETLFRHAIAVAPDNGRAHLILCQALAQQGRLGEATFEASEAARLDPENPRAHKNLGYMLYRQGRVDEAIAALRQAVELQPDYAEAHGNLAIAYGKKGWTAEAMREMSLEMKLRAAQAAR